MRVAQGGGLGGGGEELPRVTPLARDNPNPLCSPRERAGAKLRVTGEHGSLVVRLSRRLANHLPRSSGPCDQWTGFPEAAWYYDALGYNRHSKCNCNGVTLYSPDRMAGGVITWSDIAVLFRPRVRHHSSDWSLLAFRGLPLNS